MYIHWTYHHLPKTFGILSFIAYPMFIYLLLTEQKSNSIGKYRFLLLFFAIFDMTYSTVELVAPVGIHGTGSAFIICLTDGPFYGKEEGSDNVKTRSWAGILILTGISTYAVSLYIVLGYKIMRHLHENPALSVNTQNMHRQLFRALSVQTFIPICISFSPCMAAWYGPVLGLDLGMWNNYLGVIALSAFPFMDPLAIVFLLPGYRNRILRVVPKPRIRIATIYTKSCNRGTTTATYL